MIHVKENATKSPICTASKMMYILKFPLQLQVLTTKVNNSLWALSSRAFVKIYDDSFEHIASDLVLYGLGYSSSTRDLHLALSSEHHMRC